jgi:hypothetical protein
MKKTDRLLIGCILVLIYIASILYLIKQDTSRLREYKYKQESPEIWIIMDDLDDVKTSLSMIEQTLYDIKEKSWN